MKKLLPFLLIFILLLALPCYGADKDVAKLNLGIVAGGVAAAAGCSETTPDSQTTNNDYWYLGSEEGKQFKQSPFTAAGTGTYTVKTLYVSLKKIGTPTSLGNITAYLCTTTNNTTQIGTCTTSDGTVAATAVTGDFTNIKFQFASGVSLTNGTFYHVMLGSDGVQDAANYIQWASHSSFASPGCYTRASPCGTGCTLNAEDTTCQFDFILKNCLE